MVETTWKVSKYGVFSGPYFPAFGLNTERYGDTFYAVSVEVSICLLNHYNLVPCVFVALVFVLFFCRKLHKVQLTVDWRSASAYLCLRGKTKIFPPEGNASTSTSENNHFWSIRRIPEMCLKPCQFSKAESLLRFEVSIPFKG